MIAHRITFAELSNKITTHYQNWFDDASEILAGLPAVPASADFKPLWKEIKGVLIGLQHSKCCYCETALEGNIEQDVDHFRPKARVKPWKGTKQLVANGIIIAQSALVEPGYRSLAYHPFNYAISCKNCNSVLKKNLFPIAGLRNTAADDPRQLGKELAYLIYPIGDFDDDPERLITFSGLSPIPVAKFGFKANRARVTIHLFKLDSATERPSLYDSRARLLLLLYLALVGPNANTPPALRNGHQPARVIANLTADTSPFANCMRSFQKLFNSDRTMADRYAEECLVYLESKGLADKLPK